MHYCRKLFVVKQYWGDKAKCFEKEKARLPTALQVCIKVYFTKTLQVKYSKYFIFSCEYQKIHVYLIFHKMHKKE